MRHRRGPAICHHLLASAVAKVMRSARVPFSWMPTLRHRKTADGEQEDRPENERVLFFVGDIGEWRARCRVLARHGRQ